VTWVAQPVLKDHRQLVRKYASCSDTPESVGTIRKLLTDLLQDANLAHYILRLDLGPIHPTVCENNDDIAFNELLPLLRNLRTLSIEQHDFWMFTRCYEFALNASRTSTPVLSKLSKVDFVFIPQSRIRGLFGPYKFSTLPSLRLLSIKGAETLSGGGIAAGYIKMLPQQSYVTRLDL